MHKQPQRVITTVSLVLQITCLTILNSSMKTILTDTFMVKGIWGDSNYDLFKEELRTNDWRYLVRWNFIFSYFRTGYLLTECLLIRNIIITILEHNIIYLITYKASNKLQDLCLNGISCILDHVHRTSSNLPYILLYTNVVIVVNQPRIIDVFKGRENKFQDMLSITNV